MGTQKVLSLVGVPSIAATGGMFCSGSSSISSLVRTMGLWYADFEV